MTGEFHKRRGHARRIAGRLVNVREALVFKEKGADRKQRSYPMVCPICGKTVLRIRMPNSGAAFFETRDGLRQVKHPCFTIGRGLSKKRDAQTLDLFGDMEANVDSTKLEK
ncbi:MAG: hypothetical protein RLP98_07455 [Devosia sp.]